MRDFTLSIYSDGTSAFVSNTAPGIGDKITIFVRFLHDDAVKDVLLWRLVNGAEAYLNMEYDRTEGGLDYYKVNVKVNEPRLQYHFVITTDTVAYFYTQAGVTTTLPDYKHDFVIMADYVKPDWVDGAVFYQIFPERFCNGDESITVRTGEYTYRGHTPTKISDWNLRPLPYDQGHGMDFFGGDLYGVKEKIPYLRDLGVTAVYLNPIFASYSTHKYDCNDYFHVDEHFGGDEALAELSAALHEAGLKLVLDISINHTGIENKWTTDHREFYFKKEDGSLLGWWDLPTLPVLDYRNEELRDLIYRDENSVLKKWLKAPYNIDGWRFDVADVFAKNDDVQLASEVWQEVCDAIRSVKKDAIIIGEHWADCSEYLQGGLWNTPMNYFGFGRIVRQFAGLPDLFLERSPEIKKVKYEMTARDVVCRSNDHYTVIPQAIADCQMNLFDSHDVPRVHNYSEISFDKYRGVVLSYLLYAGIPCIYYGDELGIDGHTENDSGCRFPMPWDKTGEERDKFYHLYKRMAELRRNVPAFAKGGRKVLLTDGKILVVARFMNDEKYIGVISMEDQEKEISVPLWQIGAGRASSDADEFGSAFKATSADGCLNIMVPANGAYIIKVE
ncbi:alpha-glycosidase [Butyrivibrio sp. CB08]|uniref:alpha amylase N-terminal ig-like domain-containing protein n=1 Tax=Butyrivibrio sp. CB08 TaxID=2364879 RepID=UPI000EA9F587|nr:alpha amylase N-terminal ig-like domain-containing protein [Butyrivibrio sp. CB08]RKM62163.1 alpha-glycosidase [Butyrivibrio sp. CB08]